MSRKQKGYNKRDVRESTLWPVTANELQVKKFVFQDTGGRAEQVRSLPLGTEEMRRLIV